MHIFRHADYGMKRLASFVIRSFFDQRFQKCRPRLDMADIRGKLFGSTGLFQIKRRAAARFPDIQLI